VTSVTGSKVLRILKGHGLGPEIPEDLYFLIKKAVSMRKHLERNRKDKDGKFRLILIESRIHRLARYYKVRPAQQQQQPAAAGLEAIHTVAVCKSYGSFGSSTSTAAEATCDGSAAAGGKQQQHSRSSSML
jgi:ribosomal protein S15P/S13E